MKTRSGFVSNSSSSSFCIFGARFDDFPTIPGMPEKFCPEGMDEDEWDEDDSRDDFLRTAADAKGIQYWNPWGEGTIYLGVPWSSIGGEETGNQFRARVAGLLAEFLGAPTHCITLEH